MKTSKSYWVKWRDGEGGGCAVASNKSAKDAFNKAKQYFDIYSPKTIYRLVEKVETETVLKKFKKKDIVK